MNTLSIIFLIVLSILCVVLAFILFRQKKALGTLLDVVLAAKDGEERKVFIDGSGLAAQVGDEVNLMIAVHHAEIEQYKGVDQANREMLAGFAHDIATPMSGLLGYLDLLNEGLTTGSKDANKRVKTDFAAQCTTALAHAKDANKKARDLKGILDTLFDWFKIESEVTELATVPTDLCELTKQILIEWMPICEQKTVTARLELSEDAYIANIDPAAYRRMIGNLIQNALEHSRCHSMDMAVRRTDEAIIILLRDDGMGIPQGKLAFVFERTYDSDQTRSRPNSGLGLCIAKELCERQGGTIEVQSKEGEYTEFVVTLPRYRG